MSSEQPLPPPPWRRPASKPRQQLSTDAIVEVALRIMDAEGLDAVSMRRVAHELGTGPASLYAHVRNKRDLHELMLDAVFREVDVPEPDPLHWQQQLKDLCRELARIMLASPGIARIAMETLIPTTPGLIVSMDAMIGMLRCGGIPDHRISAALDGLALYVTAYAYEASLWPIDESGQEEARRRIQQIQEYVASLPPERVPHMHAVHPHFAADDAIDHFEFALDIFIAGLATYAEPN